jgi:hypothetical protein
MVNKTLFLHQFTLKSKYQSTKMKLSFSLSILLAAAGVAAQLTGSCRGTT